MTIEQSYWHSSYHIFNGTRIADTDPFAQPIGVVPRSNQPLREPDNKKSIGTVKNHSLIPSAIACANCFCS